MKTKQTDEYIEKIKRNTREIDENLKELSEVIEREFDEMCKDLVKYNDWRKKDRRHH